MPNGSSLAFKQVKTFNGVVRALGGKREVARICAGQDLAAVCNWKRRRERFPTKYYIVMKDELNARGVDAPYHLWGFVEKKL